MTENVDDVAQTLAEYERLAISSGAKVQIDPPEFMGDTLGGDWSPLWLGGEPEAARATVYRDGVPTTVYVSWDESLPAEESWRALWVRKPMKLFGAYALRAALRRAFRDVIGDRREPDEKPAPGEPSAELVARDWGAEIAAAMSVEKADQVWADSKGSRPLWLEKAWKDRRAQIIEAEWTPGPVIDPAIELSPEEAVKDRAFFPFGHIEGAIELTYEPVSARREFPSVGMVDPIPARHVDSGASVGRPDIRRPQDHKPPQNRAARRASKKGRRS